MASGSGIVPETPSPPSSPQPTDAVDTTVVAPFTQAMLIPDILSASPTPVFSPAPSIPRPPQITPIGHTPTPPGSESDRDVLDENSLGGSRVNTSSDPLEPVGTLAKSKGGPFPFR